MHHSGLVQGQDQEMQESLNSVKCIPSVFQNSGSPTLLSSLSQPLRVDQAGLAHIVKALAFPIPSAVEGLVYSLRRLGGVGTSN